MVVFDASILVLLLDPEARPPADPETAEPVSRCKDRLEHLIAAFERERTKVIIPTPVLSEVLVRAGKAGPAYLDTLSGSARFLLRKPSLTRGRFSSGPKLMYNLLCSYNFWSMMFELLGSCNPL